MHTYDIIGSIVVDLRVGCLLSVETLKAAYIHITTAVARGSFSITQLKAKC